MGDDYRIELYNKRNDRLKTMYETVSPYSFYRFIFPEGSFSKEGHKEERKPNGIVKFGKRDDKTGRRRFYDTLMFDDLNSTLAKTKDHPFAIISNVGYSGKRMIEKNAYTIFGLTFDVDDVSDENLLELLWQINKKKIPKPTFIVNSGGGVHLHYIFDTPYPCYANNRIALDSLKRSLNAIICNKEITSKNQNYQGLYQGYRAPGSLTKMGVGYPVIAYRVGDRVSIDYLNSFFKKEKRVIVTDKSTCTLEEAKERWPEWFAQLGKAKAAKHNGKANDKLYFWWLGQIYNIAEKGTRYWCLVSLFVFAVKCGIDKNMVMIDATSTIEEFNRRFPEDPFTSEDVEDASTFYDKDFAYRIRFETINKWTGEKVKIKEKNRYHGEEHRYRSNDKAKANGQKCVLEERAWEVRDRKYPNDSWRNKDGRPTGRSKQREEIVNWCMLNKDKDNYTEKRCAQELGIDIRTVKKWWEGIPYKNEQIGKGKKVKETLSDETILGIAIRKQGLSKYASMQKNAKNIMEKSTGIDILDIKALSEYFANEEDEEKNKKSAPK